VTLARTIRLHDDGPRTETCRSVFNVLMCKFYKCYISAVVGVIIKYKLVLQYVFKHFVMSSFKISLMRKQI